MQAPPLASLKRVVRAHSAVSRSRGGSSAEQRPSGGPTKSSRTRIRRHFELGFILLLFALGGGILGNEQSSNSWHYVMRWSPQLSSEV